MADAKKPEAPRPAAPAVKTAAVVPAKSVAVATKTAAIPARVGAVPVKTAGVAAKVAGVPVKTAATGAVAPAKTAAVPAKTAAVPAKPSLASRPATAGATDVATQNSAIKDPTKPEATQAAGTENKAASEKDKAATAGAASGEEEPPNFEEMRNKFKPAKKSVAIPTELLGDAKSYDDKLILVKILTEKEQSRVVLMVKNMLRSTNAAKKK